MKRISLFATLPIIYMLTVASDCDVRKVCQATYLADLVLSHFEAQFEYLIEDDEVFLITHAVINLIDDIVGCEHNASAASAHNFRQQIYFSPDGAFTNPELVDQVTIPINELNPGQLAEIGDNLIFKADGFYEINSFVDIYDEVAERSEYNNEEANPLERSSSDNRRVIHISKKNKSPEYDENGNRIYIERLNTVVNYN